MREISQVVGPRTNTQSNKPSVVSGTTKIKWNKVNPVPGANHEPIVLRPYQIEAVQSVGACEVGSRIIADEMRVGKTASAIGIDFQARADLFYRDKRKCGNNCTLIVCPKKVLSVWSDHLVRMGVDPSRIVVVDLPKRDNVRGVLKEIADSKRLKNRVGYYVILNWDSVQLLEREIMRCGPWFHVIGDEIHRIKNRDAKRTVAFKHISAKQKTGLTGTPADNAPEDFWSALNWIDSKQFSSFWDFVDRYCTTATTRTGYKYVTGTKTSAMGDLHEKISPFYLRRKLSDVSDWLPSKTYRTEYVSMGRKQRTDYNNMATHRLADLDGQLLSASIKLVELTYLQQMAIGECELDDNGKPHVKPDKSPKIDWIVDYAKDSEGSEGTLIFAQRPEVVYGIQSRLETAGFKSVSITGDTIPELADYAKQSFTDGSVDFFVGTIAACKEGIDLSRASTIIIVDRDWNPSAMEQVLARADAVNKVQPVEVIYLETEDSVDQYRTSRIDNKGKNVKLMIGD